MLQEWEKREQHDTDIRAVLHELNCLDKKNRIRRWISKCWPELNKFGHDSLDYNKCACRLHNYNNHLDIFPI